MAVTIKDFSEMIDKDVFTERGVYCGKVSDIELDLEKFKVRAVVVDAVKGSFLTTIVGSKRGVVIPYAMLQSVGDIVIIKSISPSLLGSDEKIEAEGQSVI